MNAPLPDSIRKALETVTLDDKYALDTGVLSLKTEINSIDPMQASLVGIAIAVGPNEAAYLPLGRLNLVTGLTIAVVKIALVAVVFMRLWSSRPLLRLAAATGLFWLTILFLLTFTDLVTRPVPI